MHGDIAQYRNAKNPLLAFPRRKCSCMNDFNVRSSLSARISGHIWNIAMKACHLSLDIAGSLPRQFCNSMKFT